MRTLSSPTGAPTPSSDRTSESRKRPKISPRRTFFVAARTFLTLALATCAFGAAASAQTISIAPPANTSEGSGNGQTPFEFTVSIDQAPTQPVTVNFSINNGTATGSADGSNADFANGIGSVIVNGTPSTSNTLTFAAGSVATQTIVVPVTADNLFEPDETFSVSLGTPSAGATTGTALAPATIVNDDNPPSISIADAAPVTEGNTGTRNANFTVSLNAISGQDVTFTYNTVVVDPVNAGDGNNGGADFTPQNNQVGVIQAGQTSTNIAVPINGDTIDEADGQFLVEISNVVGADTGNAQATGTITDDDGPTVTVSDATASEADGQIVFRIQLSAPSPQPITVTYRTASNSAQVGLDYGNQGATGTPNEITGQVTFDAFSGDPSTGTAPFIDVPIALIDDNISELPEIFNFTLIQADNSASLTGPGARRQAIGTILDNDGSPNITVSAPVGGVVEGNAGNTAAVFTIQLSNPSSRAITFRYQTVAGTATENQDYTGIPTARVGTIAAGQTSTTVSVNVIGDLIDEANETFGLRVFGAAPSDVTVGNSSEQTATATIIDDDGPTISVTPTNVNVTEGNAGARTSAAFTVQLNQTSPQDITVNYVLGNPNNANEATRGSDYTSAATAGRLTFPAGSNIQLVPVSIIGDNVKENNEVITLTLSAPTGSSLGNNSTGTITIIDDDATPTLNIVGPGAAREGSTNGQTNFIFRVALDRASSQEITVNYTVNDGTATVGSDFIASATTNPLTFPAGTIGPLTITVPVLADRLNEDDENFSVSLSGATGARIGLGSATATILNDDAVPTLSISDVSNVENGDPPPQGQQQGPRIFSFPVRLSAPSGKDVVFSYTTIGADANNPTLSALSGSDFTPAQGQILIPAGQTNAVVNVTIIDDALDENTELFSAKLLSATNATIARATATGSIIDNDAAPDIKITAPDANNTAIEPYSTAVGVAPSGGRNAIFPVTLSAPSGRTITVRYTVVAGADPGANNADFLALQTDNTRIFQSGILTFAPNGNGVTPTTQNIVLFPRGDDGDEDAAENYAVNITVTNANFAAVADATAGSTIADRDPLFNNFTPDIGFESFGNVAGTILTLTGNQFVTDGRQRVAAVQFTGPTGVALNATILSVNATTITARVPALAYSSTITVLLTGGRVLATADPGSRRLFYVQPIITGFTPARGVPAVTAVTITGRHFLDPRNQVTGVLFNGINATAANSDRGYTIVSDTQIIAYVPRGSSSGQIAITTQFGGTGPGSQQAFTVDSFNTGSVRFIASDLTPIYENAQATIRTDNGQILNPVRAFTFQLNPATANNGNNTPIAPRRAVDVTITLTAAVPAGNAQFVPIVQIDPRVRLDGITLIRSSGPSFTFRIAAGRDPNLTVPIIITYAGDDTAPPAAQGALSGATDPTTGLTLPVANSGVQMTLRAEITASADTELYPNNGFQELSFERRDIHTFATDTGTALRTNEDQNAANNRADFQLDLANLDFANPDPFTPNGRAVKNPINVDARPKADVVVALTSSNLNEGRLTYYVLVNGRKVYPSGANAQNTIQVIYATSPARAEYYRNPHFIEAIGQDDLVSDGDQQYVITATTSTSKDPEYNIPLQLPFVLVNTDNEQSANGGDPGVLFSKTSLTTNENGSTDAFTTRLRIAPTANVVMNLETDRPDEVLFVDPNNPTGPGLSSINVTFLATGTGSAAALSTNYRVPLVIRVKGVDDSIIDGDQQVDIISTIVSSADARYASINPPDLIDTNVDNESNGVTVFPTTLNILENATDTFAVRLNAPPTSNVIITFSSSDPSTADVVSGNTLTFTPSNYNTLQNVTVRGITDGTFTAQRTATIISSAASSGDPNFNNLTVADVSVIVRNNDSAFIVSSPSAGLSTSEGGLNDQFTVSLGQLPTANVTLTLTASPATEARLSRTTGGATPSLALTFTPANYATPQTVNVIGQDDTIVDGAQTFTITGRVTTTDPSYAQQTFPALTGVNADNDGAGGGGGGGNASSTVFAANSTYSFSVPYASTTAANATIAIRSLFTPSTATDFKIYRYDVANQKNSRIVGEDFQLLANTATLQRGVGYLLQTGATQLTLNTPTTSSAVKAFAGTSFSLALTRNKNFVNQTGQTNANNGFNFIGFPFNPAQYGSVSFTSAQVTSGTDVYTNLRDAAAAGVISDRLYTTDAKGSLVQVSASDQVLRPYRAYFVQIYRDNVTLTFTSPSAN